ncbi:MAG: hypothetical protein JW891_06630 [Candidatus Lokiarchaeota archaeon]|nr:hypothetical protein [Candidatus Lokiarchaeota archaeon]
MVLIKEKIVNKKMGKSVAGAVIGLIGAIMLTIAGVIGMLGIGAIEFLLSSSGESWATLGADPTFFYLNLIMTLVLGILALVGAIVAFKKGLPGGIILLIAGGVALVGAFIPVGVLDLTAAGGSTMALTFNSTLFFVDPILCILGGILAIALKGD